MLCPSETSFHLNCNFVCFVVATVPWVRFRWMLVDYCLKLEPSFLTESSNYLKPRCTLNLNNLDFENCSVPQQPDERRHFWTVRSFTNPKSGYSYLTIWNYSCFSFVIMKVAIVVPISYCCIAVIVTMNFQKRSKYLLPCFRCFLWFGDGCSLNLFRLNHFLLK